MDFIIMYLCLIYIYRRIKNILCSKIWLFGEIKQGRNRKKISKQDIRDLQFAWKAVSTKSGKNFDSLPIKLRRRNIRKEKKKKNKEQQTFLNEERFRCKCRRNYVA